MTDKTTIESHLIEAATSLAADAKVSEALAALVSDYGVLLIGDEPVALVTREQLAALADPAQTLGEACASLVPLVVVERAVGLDDLTEAVAEFLVDHPEIEGAVVTEGGAVTGVLPRWLIAEHSRRGPIASTRAFDGSVVLPGAPQSPAAYFTCPQGDFVRLVPFYNSTNPPLCPNHHVQLKRKK